MRYKVVYDNAKLKISILDGGSYDRAPSNSNQHGSFICPTRLHNKIDRELQKLITPKMQKEITDLYNEQREIIKKQQKFMAKIRAELNPQIFKECQRLKSENVEWFI